MMSKAGSVAPPNIGVDPGLRNRTIKRTGTIFIRKNNATLSLTEGHPTEESVEHNPKIDTASELIDALIQSFMVIFTNEKS